jgi:hypothetical protein
MMFFFLHLNYELPSTHNRAINLNMQNYVLPHPVVAAAASTCYMAMAVRAAAEAFAFFALSRQGKGLKRRDKNFLIHLRF